MNMVSSYGLFPKLLDRQVIQSNIGRNFRKTSSFHIRLIYCLMLVALLGTSSCVPVYDHDPDFEPFRGKLSKLEDVKSVRGVKALLGNPDSSFKNNSILGRVPIKGIPKG